jgi:hypothetical protein
VTLDTQVATNTSLHGMVKPMLMVRWEIAQACRSFILKSSDCKLARHWVTVEASVLLELQCTCSISLTARGNLDSERLLPSSGLEGPFGSSIRNLRLRQVSPDLLSGCSGLVSS